MVAPGLLTPAPSPTARVASAARPREVLSPATLARLARRAGWIAAAALGVVQTWANRFHVVNDGVAYLDVGDAFARGDWAAALNAHWSPLFAWATGIVLALVRPAPRAEPLVVHAVTLAIFVAATAAFDRLLREAYRTCRDDARAVGREPLPEWGFVLLGYAVFLWASLDLITAHGVTPDMAIAAVLYLASALLLRIRRGAATARNFALLGALLGVGYLTKAPMLPLALVILPVALLAEREHGRTNAWRRALTACAAFALVAAPLVVALSLRQGRPTFGESRTYVAGVYVAHQLPLVHWQGEPPESGTPRHPTRRVLDGPAVYVFDRPLGGTYPPWHEPAYWYDGVDARPTAERQLQAFTLGAGRELRLLAGDRVANTRGASRTLLAGLVVLLALGARGRSIGRDVARYRVLIVPAVALLAMYAMVHVEARYVAPGLALLLLCAIASVRVPRTAARARAVAAVTLVAAAASVWPLARDGVWSAYGQLRALRRGDAGAAELHGRVAASLGRAGVRPGDALAYIGSSTNFYWARLAGARIVAEVRQFAPPQQEVWYMSAAHAARVRQRDARDVDAFWAAAPERQAQVLRAFARAGARHVVTNALPAHAPRADWRPIDGTSFHVRALTPDARVAR